MATAGSNLPAVFWFPKFQLSIACYRTTTSSDQRTKTMQPLTQTPLLITFMAAADGLSQPDRATDTARLDR